ncbi:MAG: hypothetical protein DRQ49_04405 [Gammaproteobacteria bacterium]|nr:MAG: hypothetical protein DRQ49_04405 [Gammaproteobacteria bacterium]RKZ44080.1 MAG: hypothetical protein DRQ41_03675 [Gammaproteobacteria bacterium]
MKLKFFLGYTLTLLFTLILLEVSSFFLFQSLTKKEFSYAAFQNERLARIAAIQKRLQTTQSPELYNFHPYLGYVGRPGAYPWGEIAEPFNEYGMLSMAKHPYPYKKGKNEFVIAVVGGSVAEIFANITEKFLEQYLREKFGFDKKLVLVNLATGGYKQPQQLFHVQYALLAGFEFDAVLNIDGFNDLALANDNINNQINPIFPSGFHIGLMSKTQMTNQLDFQTAKHLYAHYSLYETELSVLSFTQSFPFKYSIFFNLLGELWTKRSLIEIKKTEYKLTFETQKTMSNEFRGPLFQNQNGNPYEVVANIWQQASTMLYAICQANRLIYIHVLQPNQYVEGSKPLSDKEKKMAFDPNLGWGIAAREGYTHLISKGEQLSKDGIPFYDLSMIFKDSTEDLYTDICCHFNTNGNVIMGKNIAEILLRELQKQKF